MKPLALLAVAILAVIAYQLAQQPRQNAEAALEVKREEESRQIEARLRRSEEARKAATEAYENGTGAWSAARLEGRKPAPAASPSYVPHMTPAPLVVPRRPTTEEVNAEIARKYGTR